MSGTVSFVCWISWFARCFPADIFFQTGNSVMSSGKKDRRRTCGDEIETNQFGVKELRDCKSEINSQICWRKSNFIREECYRLLRLFNILSFPMISCSQFRSRTNLKPCRRSIRKENLEKRNVCWQNRSQWWVRYRKSQVDLQHWIRVHLTAQGHSIHEVRVQTALETSCERCEGCERKHRIEFSTLASRWKHEYRH